MTETVREEEVRVRVVVEETGITPSVLASTVEEAVHPSVVIEVKEDVPELAREPVPRNRT